MKFLKKFIVIILAALMLLSTACGETPPPEESESAEAKITAPNEGDTVYNIIFALATIPPVIAALDCIENGYETYAIIERGKTYSGIEGIEHFHNVGFDPSNNLSNGFTDTEFNAMVDKVKELRGDVENVFFNFYVQDGTALRAAAIAANAGLTTEQFHVYMYEDGTGAYAALNNAYFEDKTVNDDGDQVLEAFKKELSKATSQFNTIMSKTDNQNGDNRLMYNIAKAYALATMPNFTYCIQDRSYVEDIVKSTGDRLSTLVSAFGFDGAEPSEYKLNLQFERISEKIDRLTAEQKSTYLSLVYGEYYEATYEALVRESAAGKEVPKKKLVFIGSRHGLYPRFASSSKHGVGGLSYEDELPQSYEELDDRFKSALLFPEASDYELLLDVLNDQTLTEGFTDEARKKAQIDCFNYYIDYIFTLKFTYALYGDSYDIIMKGHPREAIGCYEEWGQRYKVTLESGEVFVYDGMLDGALLAFHESDSVGKYIGMVPYGTPAENLAYLGADIAIAGLPSSTYSGYDTDVDVLFILADSDQDIDGGGAAESDSQVAARYRAGNLLFTNAQGEKVTTLFYNTGNVYSAVSEIYASTSEEKSAAYLARFKEWLEATHPGSSSIDGQGFPENAGK